VVKHLKGTNIGGWWKQQKSLDNIEQVLNFVMVGDPGVGKTSFVLRAAGEPLTPAAVTAKRFYFSKQMNNKSVGIQVQELSDTPNPQKIPENFCDAAVVFIFFDFQNENSFKNVNTWLELQKTFCDANCGVFLVGNKSSNNNNELTTRAKTLQIPFFETNCKQNIGIFAVLDSAMHKCCGL